MDTKIRGEEMSRTISIDVRLNPDNRISAQSILETLIGSGWNPMNNGLINYLPVSDKDMYSWTKEEVSLGKLLKIVDLKEREQEVIGVDLYWGNSNIGISLLIFNLTEVSFGLNINRKYIDDATQLIDFNWYALRILPDLCKAYNVSQYKFEFIY
jgi:hypothetical protein